MKLLFLSDLSVNHTRRWVDWFAEAGHECHLLTFEAGPPVRAQTRLIRSRLPRKFMVKYLAHAGDVSRYARALKPDLVSAQELGSYGPLGVWCGVRPLAVSAWGSDVLVYPERSYCHKKRVQYVLRHADLITSPAPFMTEKIVALGGEAANVVESALGIDAAAYPQATRPPRATAAVVLIHSRHFKPVYNIGQLLDALPAIFAALPGARLVMLSDGPHRRWAERRVAALGLTERVTFSGALPMEAVAARLRDADIFITTSRSDSINISLLEAMASGCYPVVTDIPATRYWLEGGARATRVPVGDPSALAAAVIAAAGDEAGRLAARVVNRELVVTRANRDEQMRRVEAAFKDLVARGRR